MLANINYFPLGSVIGKFAKQPTKEKSLLTEASFLSYLLSWPAERKETWVETDCAEHVHGYQATKSSRDEQRRLVWLAVLFFSAQSSHRAKVSKQGSLTKWRFLGILLESSSNAKEEGSLLAGKKGNFLRVHLMKVHQQNGDKPCVTRQKRLRGRLIFNRLENPFGKITSYHFTCVDAWLSAIHWEKLQKIIDHNKVNTISLRCYK